MRCSVTSGISRSRIVWRYVASWTSVSEIDNGSVLDSAVPVSSMQLIVLICRSFITRMNFRTFALCVGSRLEQQTIKARWLDKN